MRQLTDLFEGLLDSDYDVDDAAVLVNIIKQAFSSHFEHNMPIIKTNGEWLEFDCSSCGNEIWFNTLDPIVKAGYSKFRFTNCNQVDMYNANAHTGTTWTDIEIDAPQSDILLSGNDKALSITNVKINAQGIRIDAEDSTEMKITMKGCKFDVAYIKFQAVTQLSISDTCKFTNCKLLYLGRIGKSVSRKANNLMLSDIRDGNSFSREAKSFEPLDETLYWDIDVMKTLSLKTNKWPDLGKIVLVPNGIPATTAPGICLYKPNTTMIPVSKHLCPFIAEYKNGWHGVHIARAKTELNCVTK